MALILSLPDELLENIAGFLPCSDVLSLSNANRRLRQVCNSRTLYQNVALDSMFNIDGAVEYLRKVYIRENRGILALDDIVWPEGNDVLQNASLDTARRYALAVEKFIFASMTNGEEWTLLHLEGIGHNDCSDWLPHLLALKHPATAAFEPRIFLRVQHELGFISKKIHEEEEFAAKLYTSCINPKAEFIIASFALSFTILQRTQDTRGIHEVLDQFGRDFLPTSYHTQSDSSINKNSVQRLCDVVPDYGGFNAGFEQMQAMAMIPPLAVELIADFANSDLPVKLPSPAKIPFASFMDIPSVLNHAVEEFTTCHVRKMATPEFLNGRRWVGYYSDQRFHRQRRFDPPMRNIKLVTREHISSDEPVQDGAVVIEDESGGVDGHGNFVLEGSIMEDGCVRMEKRSTQQGWRWYWKGRLTPFGIVAMWGGRGRFGGYVWIWDEDWS